MIATLLISISLQFQPVQAAQTKHIEHKKTQLDSLVYEVSRKLKILDSLDTVKGKGRKWQHTPKKK